MNNDIIKPSRLVFMAILMIVISVFYATVLYKLQVVDGNAYYEQSINNIVSTEVIPASRGNILDRYGRLLVSNRSCNNIIINTDELFAQDDPNAVILKLVNTVVSCGDSYIDELPITADAPFEFVDNMSDIQRTRLEEYIQNIRSNYDADFPENPTAVDLMAFFRTRYNIDDNYDARQMRIIAGIRYEINVRYVVKTSDYVFAQDVSTKTITTLLEMNLPGFTLETSYVREYNTTYACHILGHVALMDERQVDKYSQLGYPLDALVGQDGVELAFEEYLHGTDGKAQVTSTASGTVINTTYLTEPDPGGNVYITLDIKLQGVAETALESFINNMNAGREATNAVARANGYTDDLMDLVTGGGMVVMDVKTGEPLAIASYPTFDLSTFSQDYARLMADESAPLFPNGMPEKLRFKRDRKMRNSGICAILSALRKC